MPAFAAPPVTIRPETYGFDPWAKKFSVQKYQDMIRTGIIVHEDKVELLENYLVQKMPRNPIHDGTIQAMNYRLMPFIPEGWRLRCQLTVVTSDSQPEPDFAVVCGDESTYMDRHPEAADTGIVIEVSNTSLLRDQRDKFRIFARAGVPQYWIINLLDSRVEVYTHPSGEADSPAYREFRNYHKGETVPLVLNGAEAANVPVSDLIR